MRQLIPLTALLLGGHIATAQLTITAAENNPTVGDTFTQHVNSNVGSSFDVGPAGADVTWDLSSYASSTTAPVNIVAADNSNFPNATISYYQQNTESFFKTDSGAFSFYGINGTAEIIYTDPEDQTRFPMTFGDSYVDSKEGTVDAFGQTTERTGTTEVEADGYGKLITPMNQYNNALRLRLIRRDTDVVNGAETTSQDTIYFWYAEGISFPVATFFRVYSGGNLTQASFNYIEQGSNSTPEGISSTVKNDIRIFPNPVTDRLKLKRNSSRDVRAQILTIDGQKVYERTISGQAVDVSHLARGTYILQIKGDDKNVSRRFVKH